MQFFVQRHRCLSALSRQVVHACSFCVGCEHQYTLIVMELSQTMLKRLAVRGVPRPQFRLPLRKLLDEFFTENVAVPLSPLEIV